MLTQNQKALVRFLIEENPKAEYMAQLASDDDFAVAEIEEKIPQIIAAKQEVLAQYNQQRALLEQQILKLETDITLINLSQGE